MTRYPLVFSCSSAVDVPKRDWVEGKGRKLYEWLDLDGSRRTRADCHTIPSILPRKKYIQCNKRNFTCPAYTPTSSFSFIYLFVGDKELGKTILITYTLSRSPGQQVFFSASSLLFYDIINKWCPVVANRALFDLDHLSLWWISTALFLISSCSDSSFFFRCPSCFARLYGPTSSSSAILFLL